MWDIYWILPLLTDCPIAVMTCWNVDAAYHQSLRKRATGIRPQRWKRECKEMLCWEVNGPASTKGVLWCSHKVWGQVFWCSVGVESSLASTGRNSFPEVSMLSSYFITQYCPPHTMDQTGLTLPLTSLVYDNTHRMCFLWHLWAQFGLGEVRCCRCLDLGNTETDSVLLAVTGLTF